MHDDDDAAVSLLNLMWAGFLGRKDEGTLVSTCGQRGLWGFGSVVPQHVSSTGLRSIGKKRGKGK